MSLEGNLDEEKKLTDREAFIRDKEELLRDYAGKFVAYVNSELVGINENGDELVKEIQERRYGGVGVYIVEVNEEAFKEPPPIEMPGSYRVEFREGEVEK